MLETVGKFLYYKKADNTFHHALISPHHDQHGNEPYVCTKECNVDMSLAINPTILSSK